MGSWTFIRTCPLIKYQRVALNSLTIVNFKQSTKPKIQLDSTSSVYEKIYISKGMIPKKIN